MTSEPSSTQTVAFSASYIDPSGDKWTSPRPVLTSARLAGGRRALSLSLAAGMDRGERDRRRVKKLRVMRDTTACKLQRGCVGGERVEKQEKIDYALERRLNPKTKADFALLYSELEKWRLSDNTHDISRTRRRTLKRRAALAALADQEGRPRFRCARSTSLPSSSSVAAKPPLKKLNAMMAPKNWRSSSRTWQGDDIVNAVNTIDTQWAGELVGLYRALKLQTVTIDERWTCFCGQARDEPIRLESLRHHHRRGE